MAQGRPLKDTTLRLPTSQPEATKEDPPAAEEAAPSGPSIKASAEAEEALAAKRAEMIAAMQAEPEQVKEESLSEIASQGREYLMQKLREHDARHAAAKEIARPKPALSPAMQAKIDAEIARGREVQARHQAAFDAAPKREPAKVEQVARPNNMVPDPMKAATNTSVSGTFVAGHRGYSPNAT